jgi:MFS family permease
MLSDRYGRKPIIIAGSLFSSTWTVVLSVTSLLPLGKVLALGSYTLREMGIQSAAPAMRALQADLVPERVRGRLIGTLHQYNNLGAVVGPILGGLSWDLLEGRELSMADLAVPADVLPFLLSAILLALSALMVFAFVREPPRREVMGENR